MALEMSPLESLLRFEAPGRLLLLQYLTRAHLKGQGHISAAAAQPVVTEHAQSNLGDTSEYDRARGKERRRSERVSDSGERENERGDTEREWHRQMSCNCSQTQRWKPATDPKLSINDLTSSEALPSIPLLILKEWD